MHCEWKPTVRVDDWEYSDDMLVSAVRRSTRTEPCKSDSRHPRNMPSCSYVMNCPYDMMNCPYDMMNCPYNTPNHPHDTPKTRDNARPAGLYRERAGGTMTGSSRDTQRAVAWSTCQRRRKGETETRRRGYTGRCRRTARSL